jgi:tetratricopeptide (TPR) repeat protein
MTEQNGPSGVDSSANLQLQGGAAIVAPASAFPDGLPANALIVLPLSKPSDELLDSIKEAPIAIEVEQMWKMLGYNGPAVQVQDVEGRPITIGLEDLLADLDKHWQENKNDINSGRLYAQELMKYSRFEQAEEVFARLVALGGTGDDWYSLGIAQLQQEKWDKAEATLKGAQKLLTDTPFPTLHLAKVYAGRKDAKKERETIEAAIKIQPNAVNAWAYLYSQVRAAESEEAAIQAVATLADTDPNKRASAPYIALHGLYAAEESGREKAIQFAKTAVQRNDTDPLALGCLSALYAQAGDLDSVISLLAKHEPQMMTDVRLAKNYFEALFQRRQIVRATMLLNALAGSQNREVKKFALERSRAVAQYQQQQQQQQQ